MPGTDKVGTNAQALIRELRAMREANKNNKALIFTQFSDSIKFLAAQLSDAGFAYRTISGSMPMKQRAAAIDAFQKDPPTTVRSPPSEVVSPSSVRHTRGGCSGVTCARACRCSSCRCAAVRWAST